MGYERLTYHLGKAPGSDDVSCVDESVEMPCRLLDLFPHVIVAVEVEHVCDEIECILVVLNFGVQAC